jgi:hypothetical protein
MGGWVGGWRCALCPLARCQQHRMTQGSKACGTWALGSPHLGHFGVLGKSKQDAACHQSNGVRARGALVLEQGQTVLRTEDAADTCTHTCRHVKRVPNRRMTPFQPPRGPLPHIDAVVGPYEVTGRLLPAPFIAPGAGAGPTGGGGTGTDGGPRCTCTQCARDTQGARRAMLYLLLMSAVSSQLGHVRTHRANDTHHCPGCTRLGCGRRGTRAGTGGRRRSARAPRRRLGQPDRPRIWTDHGPLLEQPDGRRQAGRQDHTGCPLQSCS